MTMEHLDLLNTDMKVEIIPREYTSTVMKVEYRDDHVPSPSPGRNVKKRRAGCKRRRTTRFGMILAAKRKIDLHNDGPAEQGQ